jgi:hypothetical protein
MVLVMLTRQDTPVQEGHANRPQIASMPSAILHPIRINFHFFLRQPARIKLLK